MRATTRSPYGKLLRRLRKQAGLSPKELATFWNVSPVLIKLLEEGKSEPPRDSDFYQPLRAISEFTDSTIARLLEAAEKENSQASLTQPLHILVSISLPSPNVKANSASIIVKVEPEPLRIHYSHTMPKHGSEIVDEGKWQPSNESERRSQAPLPGSGVIYDRGRLTTLAEASRVSRVKLGTLHNYLSDGKLTERGRIKGHGGGKVLIDLDELDSVLSSRKPGGRPRKIPKRLVNKRPRGRPRKS